MTDLIVKCLLCSWLSPCLIGLYQIPIGGNSRNLRLWDNMVVKIRKILSNGNTNKCHFLEKSGFT